MTHDHVHITYPVIFVFIADVFVHQPMQNLPVNIVQSTDGDQSV